MNRLQNGETGKQTTPYLILQGAESYINCKNTLNKICNIYANPSIATEARSITINDINHALGIAVNEEENYMYKLEDGTRLNNGYTGYFGDSYTYNDGDYAPENYMSDKYEKDYGKQKVGETVDGNAYYYSYNIAGTEGENKTLYDLLFAGTTSTDSYRKSYWLASPGVYADFGNANFGPGVVGGGGVYSYDDLFISYGNWYAGRMAVRPVVSLKSSVTLEEAGGLGSTAGDIWTNCENNDPQIDSGYLNGPDGLVSSEN